MKIRVLHEPYGCDTGCCGHVVEVDDKQVGRFEFDHPYTEDPRVWARKLAEEILKDYAPDCLPSIDWDTLDISEVRGGAGC